MDNESEIIKYGLVSSVSGYNARVTFPDRDNVVSFDLPVMQHNTGFARFYSMPKVGQTAICLFLATGMEDGWVIGSFYDEKQTPPKTGNVHYVDFEDGALIEYDADSKIMTLKSGGGGVIIDDDVIVKSLKVIEGISATGGIKTDGDVIAGGVSLQNHTNGGKGVDR